MIEGLGLPQGLANTDYLERYRGIGGCERVYSVFVFVCNLFQKNIFRKEEKLNYKDNISQSLFFFFPLRPFFLFRSKKHIEKQSEVFVWISLRNSPGGKAAGTESLTESQTETFSHLFYTNTSAHNNLSFSEGGSVGTVIPQQKGRG